MDLGHGSRRGILIHGERDRKLVGVMLTMKQEAGGQYADLIE